MAAIRVEHLTDLSVLLGWRKIHLNNLLKDINKESVTKSYDGELRYLQSQVLLKYLQIGKPFAEVDGLAANQIANPMQGQGGVSVSVNYRLRGTGELLQYQPMAQVVEGNSEVIYQPDNGLVIVDLVSDNDDMEQAIESANAKMDSTFDLIKKLNPEILDWNEKMTSVIIERLNAIRDAD